MRKFIIWIIAIIEWVISFTPLLITEILYEKNLGWVFIGIELVLFLLIPMLFAKLKNRTEETYNNNYVIRLIVLLQFFLANLFIAVLIYSKQSFLLENKNYYLPIFVIDFFESKQIALKLVSITLIFTLNQILYQKAKNIFD